MCLCVQCKPRWRGFKKKKEDARRVGAPCRKDLCCARTSTKQTARNTTLFWCAPVCWMRGVVWCGVRCRVIDHFNDYLLENPHPSKKIPVHIFVLYVVYMQKKSARLHCMLDLLDLDQQEHFTLQIHQRYQRPQSWRQTSLARTACRSI